MKIKDLIETTGAKVLKETDENLEVHISTDTRTIQKGDFYLPLKGATFDGEKFITDAMNKGAVGSFCTGLDGTLQVNDTLEAYLKLANSRRNKLNPKVIAITGSSGKTTTKELVSSVLSEKFKTFKTPLNHNNEIGLCQTIFGMPDDTEVLILEMGMRGLGEIELLSKYSEPDISIITNVGTAHIGRLGSRENIARAKCEIVKYQRGNVFIAHDDELIRKTVEFSGKKIFYSIKDVKIIEQTANYSKFEYKKNNYELNAGGNYNIENALSAINAGLELGLNIEEIQNGLKKYSPIEKRWEAVEAGGYKIINDSYNANPESMRAFADTIFSLYKDYVLVLGDMGELGEREAEYHKELGRYINKHSGLSKDAIILSVGKLSKNITNEITNCTAKHFDTIEQCISWIQDNVNKDRTLFLKASRSMKFENIITGLNNSQI